MSAMLVRPTHIHAGVAGALIQQRVIWVVLTFGVVNTAVMVTFGDLSLYTAKNEGLK